MLVAATETFVVLVDNPRSVCPLYKCVDHTTCSESLTALQNYYNELEQWSAQNVM